MLTGMQEICILTSSLRNNIITKSEFSFITTLLVQSHANGMTRIASFMNLVCIIWWTSKSLAREGWCISSLSQGKISLISNNRRKRFGLKLGKVEPSFMRFIISSLGIFFLWKEGERRRLICMQKRQKNSKLKKQSRDSSTLHFYI